MRLTNSTTDEQEYKKRISTKLGKKIQSLQFLPICLDGIQKDKTINFENQKLKTSYLIDIVHNLILKYYFKKENRYVLNSVVLKEKYGYLYNYYIKYLVANNVLRMVTNYKKGFTSRAYELNESIFKSKIKRHRNSDKILIKKYKKKIFDTIEDFSDSTNSLIELGIREKLISDLFDVEIQYDRSIFYLDSIKQDIDIYNRNSYSVEAINDKHIFYHFDSYGRMHTNFTILKSFIRKNCLLIDGEETLEIDIKNSQPLFLCKLISDSGTSWVKKEEFEFFKQLTINGTYYEYMMQVIGEKDINKVKEITYKVLFGRNASNSKADKYFATAFPSIHTFIKLYKKEYGDYRVLSYDLQKAESNLVYNKIIKKIMILHPDIKMLTVHDSIIYPRKYKDIVTDFFNSEMKLEFNLI
jgi:hypothetical protein